MITALADRLNHIPAVLLLPAWQWMTLGTLAILGATDTVRSDIYSALPAIPHLSALWWVIIFLVALIVCVSESSYRLLQTERSKKGSLGATNMPTYAEGGTGGELLMHGSPISGAVSGGEGGLFGDQYKAGAGGSAEVSSNADEPREILVRLRGGSGGGVGDGTGRGAKGARSNLELGGEPTNLWMYGYGGDGASHPEFARRVTLLERFIEEYYKAFPNRATFIRVGIDPMPENWVNKRLEETGESWRVTQRDGRFILPQLQ